MDSLQNWNLLQSPFTEQNFYILKNAITWFLFSNLSIMVGEWIACINETKMQHIFHIQETTDHKVSSYVYCRSKNPISSSAYRP